MTKYKGLLAQGKTINKTRKIKFSKNGRKVRQPFHIIPRGRGFNWRGSDYSYIPKLDIWINDNDIEKYRGFEISSAYYNRGQYKKNAKYSIKAIKRKIRKWDLPKGFTFLVISSLEYYPPFVEDNSKNSIQIILTKKNLKGGEQ